MGRSTDETRDGSMAAGVPPPSSAEAATLAADEVLAHRYRLIRLIARGGMGEVYEAHDLELGSRIAIKTIRAERVGDPNAVARLKQEILAARKVTHPNVIRLFDVGFHLLPDQRELAFFTMELLDGETLDARIRRGRLSCATALALARQLAAALDAAHDAGVVHRDFKSQNVILVGDRAIVTDFGLAREHFDNASTATAEFVGTPAYMAPEQVTRAHRIGPPADIYALGVVLFEMVTGDWPFRKETALATAAARIGEAPPSPSSLVVDLPASWDATILRCLERDPAKRFERAGHVIDALVASRREPLRRRIPWRAIALALAIIAFGGGYALVRRAATPACEPPGVDLYVDQTTKVRGNGSRGCPLPTITDALAVRADRKVIHLAEGFYDRAHGERFPLEIRGEVSLVGAGIDRTTISGVGSWDGRAAGGTLEERWQATIVTGDTTRRVEIANLSVASGLAHIQHDVAGIICTRGASEPNTLVHDVAIGPDFGTSIAAVTEERPIATGCNIDIDRVRIHDAATGIWQVGCGTGGGRIPVGVRVRHSTFSALHNDPIYPGAAITVWDCVRSLTVEDNTFADSDAGITMIRHAPEVLGPVAIRNNDFKLLSRHGISFFLAVDAELVGNSFEQIAGTGENLGRSPALSLVSDGQSGPTITLRDNRFIENDLAIEVTSSVDAAAVFHLDAGRPDDPGRNLFFCNSAPKQSSRPGGDIAIRPALADRARIDLAGNRWDHAPPSMAATATNGLDILSPRSLDIHGPVVHGSRCIARVP